MFSIGGTGTELRGCTRHDAQGHFEGTRWVTLVHLPILPLGRSRYRLLERQTHFPARRVLLLQHLANLPLKPADVARTYALAWVGAPVVVFAPTGILGLPGVLAGRPDLAAVGAVLSSLWLIPAALGLWFWTRGQPWPADPPKRNTAAVLAHLQQTAGLIWGAVGGAFVLVSGFFGGLAVAAGLVEGQPLQEALLSGAQVVAFFFVLCAAVGAGLWVSNAWQATR